MNINSILVLGIHTEYLLGYPLAILTSIIIIGIIFDELNDSKMKILVIYNIRITIAIL